MQQGYEPSMRGSNERNEGVITRSQSGPIFAVDRPASNRFLRSTTFCLRSEWNVVTRRLNEFVLFKYAVKRHHNNPNVSISLIDEKPVNVNGDGNENLLSLP